jgi:hypothetical protein
MKNLAWSVCAVATAALAQPAHAQDERADRPAERADTRDRSGPDWRLYLSSGVSYVTRDGELGRTNYYRVPFGARITKGPFRLSASIPYVIVRGPGSVIGEGEDEIDDALTDDGTRKGLGDLRLTARYRLPKSALGGFELDLLGRVKVPTASREKRLGTGEVDYAVGAELSRDVGQLEPFVSAQYRFNGDRPDLDYRNTVAASAGTAVRLGRRTRASVSYDYSQSRIRGRSAISSLGAGLSTRLSKRLSLSGSGSVGLSKRAPDFGLGTSITWRAF